MVVTDHVPRVEAKIFPHGLLAGVGASGAIGVDLFFVISGFIMIVTTRNMFGTPGASRTFLERRVLRIYPAYWIAMFAFILAAHVAPSVEHTSPVNAWTILTSMFLIPHKSGPIMFVAWSLQFEMYFYLVFSLALRFARERLRFFLAAWVALVLVCNVLSLGVNNLVVGLVGNPLTLEFVVGVGVGILVMQRRRLAPVTFLVTGAILSLGVAIYSSRFDGFGTHSLDWFRVLAATPGMAMIVYGAVTLEETHGAAVSDFFVRLGDASYTTYLWHGMLLGAFTTACSHLHLRGLAGDLIFIVGGFAVVIAGSQLIYRLIEDPLMRFFQRAGAGAPRRRFETSSS